MAATLLGVCIKTLRRWDNLGKIKCYRTIGGHRRFMHQELTRIINHKELNTPKKPLVEPILDARCALYGRVSTYKQKKRGDLETQIEVLKRYSKTNGLSIVKIYQDLGSGLNMNRKGLWRLIRDAKKGLFSLLIVNYKDRLTRFGFKYLKSYLEEFGVEIRVLNSLNDKAPESELVEDLVAIIQSFTGRLYGLRSHQNKKKLQNP